MYDLLLICVLCVNEDESVTGAKFRYGQEWEVVVDDINVDMVAVVDSNDGNSGGFQV